MGKGRDGRQDDSGESRMVVALIAVAGVGALVTFAATAVAHLLS